MHEPDDRELVQRCRDGDSRSFEPLVDRYQAPLYRTALRLVGNVEDAMDLTQSTFLKAYEKLDTYQPKYRFFSWIYRILVNEAINHLQRSRRQASLSPNLASGEAAPDAMLRERASSDRIQRALLALSLEHRLVIVLRHFLDFSYQEMAEVLDLPDKTVKSRLFSARRQMRDLLLSASPTGISWTAHSKT